MSARKPSPSTTTGAAEDSGSPDLLAGTAPLERPRGLVDEQAELVVLGACLTDPEAYYELADRLEASDFAGPAHQDIWRALLALDAQGRPIDPLTVADELKRAKVLARVGGLIRIEDIARYASRVENLADHAAMIADRSLARQVVRASREISAKATDPTERGTDSLAFAESTVFQIGQRRDTSGIIPMTEAVPATLAELAKVRSSLLLGHSTGYRELDKLTGGLQGGQLIVLAARPGMGKTAFGLALSRHLAEGSGDSVLFLSYEMSALDLTTRLLAGIMRAPLHELRQGRVPREMESDLAKAAKRLEALPLLVADNPPQTIAGVRAAARRLARRAPLACIVVDYLQLMSGDRSRGGDENRTQEVSTITRGLKNLARELDCPVIAMSQLNRSLETRPDKRPMLSDLRESGEIEQAADLVLFLHRPFLFYPDADPSDCELIIGKQRNGPLGKIPLEFIGPAATMVDRPANWQASGYTPPPTRGGGGGGGGFF